MIERKRKREERINHKVFESYQTISNYIIIIHKNAEYQLRQYKLISRVRQ